MTRPAARRPGTCRSSASARWPPPPSRRSPPLVTGLSAGGDALGVLVGAVVVTAFFCVSGVVVAWAGRIDDTFTLPAALGTFLVKALVLFAVLSALPEDGWLDRSTLAWTVIVGALLWSGVQLRWVWTRQLYYVPPPAPPRVLAASEGPRRSRTRKGPRRAAEIVSGAMAEDSPARGDARPRPASPARAGQWCRDRLDAVIGTMISGMAVWGGVGWLLDHWLDTRVFFPVGIILGMAVAIYLVVARYGAAPPPPGGTGTSRTPGGRRSQPQDAEGTTVTSSALALGSVLARRRIRRRFPGPGLSEFYPEGR